MLEEEIKLMASIQKAFADVRCGYKVPVEPLTTAATVSVVRDFFLMEDSDIQYELPLAMCKALEDRESADYGKLVFELADFLDVEFSDPEGIDGPLREAKQAKVGRYSKQQALVIVRWLEYMRQCQSHDFIFDILDSGIRYWIRRV